MRVILYTGKGGVGKSSIAAATAVRTAEMGRRTLLVSSDLAHNLSDIFGVPIGGEPVTIADKLDVLEVNVLAEIREHWTPAQDYMAGMLSYLGMENAVAEEVSLLPGMDEVFLLARILRELQSDRYDVVLVDCSPTAGTLRILTMTDTACTKLNKLVNVERQIMKLIRPISNRMKAGRALIPTDEVYGLFEEIIRKVGQLGEILKDPDVASIRLVLNPDRIAIAETRRAFTYCGLFGFPVDGIFVNKVLPAELGEGYLHEWFTLQQELIDSIDQSFLEVAKLRSFLLDREPIGLKTLSAMGEAIFEKRQPDEVLSASKPVSFTREDDRYRLTFRLPNIAKEELDVGRKDGELILTTGNYTRVYSLPDMLIDRQIRNAAFAEGELTIAFE